VSAAYLPMVYAPSVVADLAVLHQLHDEATLPSEIDLANALIDQLEASPRYCKCCRMADFAIDRHGYCLCDEGSCRRCGDDEYPYTLGQQLRSLG
jgi:hypothetical protein